MGKKGGGNEAAQARKDEQARQAAIRAGTANINSIFDGGTYRQRIAPTGGPMDFSSGEYYDANGNRLSGTVNKFDDEDVYGPSSSKPGQFTSDYFDKVRKNYLDYATPQLDTQHADASKQLTFSLARSGLLDSSIRGQKEADLQKTYDLNKQQIADQAEAYKSKAQSDVESARSDLISQLNATGDAQGAANSAISRASALSAPAAYSPLSDLFASFTQGLGTQAALERANYYSGGAVGSRYNTGIFAPSAGAVKVS